MTLNKTYVDNSVNNFKLDAYLAWKTRLFYLNQKLSSPSFSKNRIRVWNERKNKMMNWFEKY